MPRHLVIVRAGDNSLHTDWLGAEGERNWDIIVNYYGDNPDLYYDREQRRIDSKGPKWPALYRLIADYRADILAYDYIWFPDDDLVTNATDINRLFTDMAEFNLQLAQPSLTHDSIVGHPITLTNKSFRLRYVTFVEIMAPCFSRAFMEHCWHTFNENVSGYGLDFLWPAMLERKDQVAVGCVTFLPQADKSGHPHGSHGFIVRCSASVKIAAFLCEHERVNRPVLF